VDDVQDGLVILQVLDKISPKLVDWKSVNTNRAKMNAFNKVENCNYCVKLGKDLKFSMVGVAGKDFVDGNKKLILALVSFFLLLLLLLFLPFFMVSFIFFPFLIYRISGKP
jgi:hypothetical protein